jgi:hypothetical protein
MAGTCANLSKEQSGFDLSRFDEAKLGCWKRNGKRPFAAISCIMLFCCNLSAVSANHEAYRACEISAADGFNAPLAMEREPALRLVGCCRAPNFEMAFLQIAKSTEGADKARLLEATTHPRTSEAFSGATKLDFNRGAKMFVRKLASSFFRCVTRKCRLESIQAPQSLRR